MPITIKELFPSDPLSEALEKINFNFDQLVLAGGGPPGPPGPSGPQGVAGPLGPRGDHWFVGPSAFGQTMDHDGGSLKVEDHFLDSLGDIYAYFDNGSTAGWTATGINLIGPQGPTGPTGGSLDWAIHQGADGNAVTPPGAGWSPQLSTAGSTGIDFLIPLGMGKNAIFVGDLNWAVNKLQNLSGFNGVGSQDNTPQFSIIQKNVNANGINGLMFGAYGATFGATGVGTAEGSTGATTDAYNFVHASFVKSFNGSQYERMFRFRSFRQKFKIEVGGNGPYELGSSFEIASKDFTWVNNMVGGAFYNATTTQGIFSKFRNFENGVTSTNINLFTKSALVGGPTDAGNEFGYVTLQSIGGAAAPSTAPISLWNQHGLGNVIIGPTWNASNSTPLGVRSQQGLAIVRGMTYGSYANDASIRFFHTVNASTETTNEFSSINGGILAYRQSITNGLGTFFVPSIQIGSGYPTNLTNTINTSKIVSGRVGINNHPGYSRDTTQRRPHFPVHVNLTSYNDTGKVNSAYQGQNDIPFIESWAFGVDFDRVSGETGIYHAGIDTASSGLGIAYSYGFTGATSHTSFTFASTRAPILQAYWNMTGATNSITGTRTPNFYSQVGDEETYGNIGLGFTPWSGVTPNNTGAWAKLSIQGTLVVGNYSAGYHLLSTNRPKYGILAQGTIIQGATHANTAFSTRRYNGSLVTTQTDNNFGISTMGVGMFDKVIAKDISATGLNGQYIPNFSMPDLRTGMNQPFGQTGRAYLVVPGATTDGSGPSSPPTVPSVSAAYWANFSGVGTFGSQFAPAFVADAIFATEPDMSQPFARYTLQDLVDNGFATIARYADNTAFPPDFVSVRRSWLKIPTSHSLAVVDLDTPAIFGCWGVTGSWLGSGGTAWYLNHTNVSGSTRAGTTGQFYITLDPGKYDGQRLTLIIRDVDVRNSTNGTPYTSFQAQGRDQSLFYTRISSMNPFNMQVQFPFSTAAFTPPSLAGSAQDQAEYIVMARDYYGVYNNGNPTYSSIANNVTYNLPYAVPNGASGAISPGSNPPLSSGTTATMYSNIHTNANFGSGWSRDFIGATHGPYPSLAPNLGGGTLLIGKGWRIINFVWLNDYLPKPYVQNGCWVETGREYLSGRSIHQWATGGSFQEGGAGGPGGGPIGIG